MTYSQGFYKEEAPFVVDYGSCLRYLSAAKNNGNTSCSSQTSKFMERPKTPVDELDDCYDTGLGKIFVDSVLSANS